MLRANNRRPSNNVDKDVVKMAQKPGNGPLKPMNAQAAQKRSEVAQLKTKRLEPQDNELKCLEMASDIYKYLVHHEKKFVLDETFMEGSEVSSKMRRILVDWLVQVQVRFHLLPETLHLTIAILDQMLAKKTTVKSDLQLLGISAMFVASKFEEVFLPDVYDYEFITENAYNKQQILAMEQNILNSIKFDLSCPSSLVFSRCLSKVLADTHSEMDRDEFYFAYNISKCIGELALLDSVMSSVPRSHTAIASIVIALQVHPVAGLDARTAGATLIKELGASQDDIRDAIILLSQVTVKNFKQPKLGAIKSKYQSSSMGQVANLITDEVLKEIENMSSCSMQ